MSTDRVDSQRTQEVERKNSLAGTVPKAANGPEGILRAAIKAVPAVKYALGVAGVIAAAALVKGFFSSTQAALLVGAGMLMLMVLLLVFATATKLAPTYLQSLALFFTWAVLILFVLSSCLTVLTVFFRWPEPFASLVQQLKTGGRQTLNYGNSGPAGVLPLTVDQLPTEAKGHLQTLRISGDPAQLQHAVDYFKANPCEPCLGSLATLAARNDANIEVRFAAIGAIAAVRSPTARHMLISAAVAESTPGITEAYLKALKGNTDPSMIEPLKQILEGAGGDVVGSPAVALARELGNPTLAPVVKKYCDNLFTRPGYDEPLRDCREAVIDLATVALLEKGRGLPESLDTLMATRTLHDIKEEHDESTRVVYLDWLKRNHRFSDPELTAVVRKGLSDSDALVRWGSIELAATLNPELVRQLVRQAFGIERVPLLDVLLVDAMSRDWQPGDCSAVGSKVRQYSATDETSLFASYARTGQTLVSYLVRYNCKDSSGDITLFANALDTSTLLKDEAEAVRHALTTLKAPH